MSDESTTAPRLLYDKSSAARMLSASERRIDELRRSGRLSAVRDGRQWKYRHDELQRYVDSLQTSAEFSGITTVLGLPVPQVSSMTPTSRRRFGA